MTAPLPGHEELCRRAGLGLPRAYHDFLRLCLEAAPEDPWNAFEDLGLMSLESGTPVDPEFSLEWRVPPSAEAPRELVVFAETGAAGYFHGFFVEDTAALAGEHPVVTVASPTDVSLAALSFSDFLEQRCYCAEDDEFEEDREPLRRLLRDRLGIRPGQWSRFARRQDDARKSRARDFMKLVKEALDSAPEDAEEIAVTLPDGFETPMADAESTWARRLGGIRLRQGCVPTADGIGLRLPEGSADREYLAGLRWPEREARARSGALDLTLLVEARRRLARGEPGTALAIAKSFRYLHWYDDWKSGRRCMRETGEILEAAYRALGRTHAAHNVRVQSDWALEHVR